MSSKELAETLNKLLEKLYAGFKLYGAVIYLSYGLATSIFMLLTLTPFYEEASASTRTLVSVAYWLAAIIIVVMATTRYWRGYVARLEARLEARTMRKCNRYVVAAWASFPAVMIAAWNLASLLGKGGGLASSFSVLVALGVGNLGNALMEHCIEEKLANPPMISALLLLAGSPIALYTGWGYAAILISIAYTATALAYVHQALKKLA